jgi:hypothetical protein
MAPASSKCSRLTKEMLDEMARWVKIAKDGAVVRGMQGFLNFCKNENISYILRMPPHMVGVSRFNRDAQNNPCGMVNPMDVHALIDKLWDVGFSWSEVRALAREHSEDDNETILANEKMKELSGGKLAPFDRGCTKIISVWGAHTNAACHCVAAGVCHDNAELTIDGKLSVAKVQMRDPNFAMAALQGLEWIIIPAEVFKHFPDLESLLQSAGNIAAHMAKGESEQQVIRKIHSEYVRMKVALKPGEKVDCEQLKRAVLKSKPPCAASVPFMIPFVMKYGGGTSASFLTENEQYIVGRCSSERVVAPDLYDAICIDMKGEAQATIFRNGLMKAAYTEIHNVQKGESRWITANDAKKWWERTSSGL